MIIIHLIPTNAMLVSSRAYNKRGLVTIIDSKILNVTKNKLTRAHVIVSTCVCMHAKHAHDSQITFQLSVS